MSTVKTKRGEQAEQVESENQSDSDPKRLVELNVLAPERPYAVIDGERSEFRLRYEFGAGEDREFTRYSAEYDELYRLPKKLNREQTKRLDWLLDWLFDHVLIDPKGLRDRLKGTHADSGEPLLSGAIKRELVLTFSQAPQLMEILRLQAEAAQAQTDRDTEPERSLSTSES